MLLAQAKEVLDSAGQLVRGASDYGPASAYLAVVVASLLIFGSWICWKVIHPISVAVIETVRAVGAESIETMQTIGANVVLINSKLSDIKKWIGHDKEWSDEPSEKSNTNAKDLIRKAKMQPHSGG